MSKVRSGGRRGGAGESLYRPTWWEKRFPWLLDFAARLDPEPVLARLGVIARPVSAAIERLCQPIAGLFDRVGDEISRVRTRTGEAAGAWTRALPLPGMIRDAFWLRRRTLGPDADSAHTLWRRQHRTVMPLAIVLAVALHAAAFLLWPSKNVEDFSSSTAELEAVELPPQVEIPPPPEQIARPATPVLATAEIDEDITIAPTTFEDNPVTELPPPPTEEVVEASPGPTFTPFTVAPRVLNAEEVRGLLVAEYPPALRDAGIGAEILMWFYIDERGGVVETRIAVGSGYESLDAAAYRVAEHIRFSPALDRDANVPVWVQMPLTFSVR